MSMLDALFGGGAVARQRRDLEDFVDRYEKGAPWDDISDQEAIARYREFATRVTPDVYEEAAEEAFERLTPQQRAEYGSWLREHTRERAAPVAALAGLAEAAPTQTLEDIRLQDPRLLARATAELEQAHPGSVGQMLAGKLGAGADPTTGGTSGATPSTDIPGLDGLVGAVMGGGAPASRGMPVGGDASPVAKGALAGIAAMAMQRMMNRR
jgi:hypothetical protein